MKKVISLGGGEPEYRTPVHIVEAMKRAMDEGYTHYGDFRHIPELREAVAARYRRMGVEVDAERVIITPGSTMGIYMAYKALMEPGEEFLTMDPCFFGYYDSVDLLGVKPVTVPRYKEEEWKLHVEDLHEACSPRTRALLICSPDNPTGAVLKDAELKEIADFAKEKNLIVISDEIYDEITYDGVKARSIASLPGMAERTLILNGLSKAYAMTGWRVGYMVAPNEALYKKLFSIQMATYLVLNSAVQWASAAALTGPQDCVREMVRGYREKRDYCLDRWSEIPKARVTKPDGAFYLFPDLSTYGYSSKKMAEYLRSEAGVGLTPGHVFGRKGEGHVRNAYAQSMADLEEGLDRVKRALGKL
jgi:aminotransferase